jgi:hypothetical protein
MDALGGQRFEKLRAAGGEQQAGAAAGQCQGQIAADAARGAGE